MKTCSKCKLEKNESCFNSKGNKLQSYCTECNIEYQKQHYIKNKNKYIVNARKTNKIQQEKLREKLWNYYLDNPCVDCGETNPIVLEFDHLKNKSFNISEMVRRRFSWSKIEQEISKCEVRCSNCHKIKTARQLEWYKEIMARSSNG